MAAKMRYHTDPNFKIKKLTRSRILHALKGHTKSASTFHLVGCTIHELKTHLQRTAIENGYKDFDINNYSGKEYHIDHVIPCIKFNLINPEEQCKCFHYSNMQILSSSENLHKHSNMEK